MTHGKKFNPEMLLLARDLRGYTQKELGKLAEITQGFISQIEDGDNVSEQVAERFSTVLRLPVQFFYQEEHYTGFGISLVYYRKRGSALISHLRRLQAEVNIRRIHAKGLLRGVNFSTPRTFEFADVNEHGATPEEVAIRLRANWMLPIGPVRNLVNVIESAGGLVFRFPFGTTDIDAMSQWPDDSPPLFFLNSEAPADRIRFSLAHELGHIVMHNSASDEMEPEADQFASEFLMPKRDIGSDLIGMDLTRAAALKQHWRVSMAAIIRRARDLNKITEQNYRFLFMRLGALGYRKREPSSITPEDPTVIPRLINVYLQESGMSIGDLAMALHWPQDEFVPMYLPASGLRLAQ